MKGLLVKDLCLLRNQKRLLPIFLILTAWFTVLHTDGFSFPFLGMMAVVLSMSTVSYDEVDRGMTHLFTLPFDRRTYVQEKYVLAAILLVCAVLLALISTLIRQLVAHDVDMDTVRFALFLALALGVVFISIMLPIRIRFGGEKGMIIFYVVFAVIALLAVGIAKLLPKQAEAIADAVLGMSIPKAVIVLTIAAAALLIVSYCLSVKWINKKEF